MTKVFSFFQTLTLVSLAVATLSACHHKETARPDKEKTLSDKIWESFDATEKASTYKEVLTPELLQTHESGLAFIRGQIPLSYPEPYLPYGKLSNRTLDPGLSSSPILDRATVTLGKALFEDKSLSFSNAHGFSKEFGLSCQSCHQADKEFSDGEALSRGIEGDLTPRNSPSLWNAAYYSTLTWSNPHFPLLEMQAKIPLFNDDPIEMGLRGKELDIMTNLSNSNEYRDLFQAAFQIDLAQAVPNKTADYNLITKALAAFERSLIRFDSRFDLYLQNKGDLNEEEKLGAALFYGISPLVSGQSLTCSQCHSGFLMTDSFQYVRKGTYFNRSVFHNTIRTPGLRFVSKTAPYLHDGSLSTLDEVLDLYANAGRVGTGASQPAFALSAGEKKALLAFLESL